jgi:hypothetical protein
LLRVHVISSFFLTGPRRSRTYAELSCFLKLITVRVSHYSFGPNQTRSTHSPMRRPGRSSDQKYGTWDVWLATVYSLTVTRAMTYLQICGTSNSLSSILVASIKRSEHSKRYSDRYSDNDPQRGCRLLKHASVSDQSYTLFTTKIVTLKSGPNCCQIVLH